MYTMKKSLIAVSIAAMPLAGVAELQPMNDTQMSGVTGQAGVTIELSTEASIDSIEYSQGANTGSVLMNNVRIGGHDAGETLDIDVNIDLVNSSGDISRAAANLPGDLEDGDAFIEVRPLGGASTPVEAGIDVGSVGLASSDGSNTATLISDISADFWVTQLDITTRVNNAIAGGDPDTGSIRIRNKFAAQMDADFDVAAVSLSDVVVAGGELTDDMKAADPNMQLLSISSPAEIEAEIGAGPAISGSSSAPDETLRVDLQAMNLAVWMPEVNVGSGDGTTASIGSVGISNLQVSDTQMAIYGRE